MQAFPQDAAAAAGLAAPEAAELTPHKDEAPGVTAEGFRAQGTTTDTGDFRADAHALQAVAQALRRRAKRLIVLAACWGFPATWAHWLIERGGLKHD